MRLSKSLGLAFGSLVAAQEWVAAPKGLEVVSSKLFNGAEISYKKTSVCETTEGVNAYSGYVSLPKSLLPDFQHWDEKQKAHFFFWYFEARNNPSTAPTSIYIGGGPGSSSFDNTNGFPCSVNADSNSTTLNDISWNKHVNMLYIDQPLGTGFSFPEWQTKNDEISLWTSSYGGFYGPNYFSYFQDQNTLISNSKPTFANAKILNLATLGLQEPGIDARAMAKGYADYGHHNNYGLQFFDDKTYKGMLQKIEEPETGCYALTDKCRALVAEGDPERFGNNKTVNEACLAATNLCFFGIQGTYQATSDRSPFDITHSNTTLFPKPYIENFFNQPWVQRDLGVPLNFTTGVNNIGKVWLGQTGDIMIGSLHAVERVVERGVNVALIYADRDYRCPWYGGENISLSLNFSSAEEFRSAGYTPIKTNCSYTAGFVREHGNVSFSRIFESGHGVAGYQPEALSTIFNRVMSRRDLATGEVDLRKHTGYKTKGRKSVRSVRNKVPESPVNTCFVRDAPLSCTDEQLMALAVGKAKVENWVVVEPKGEKPKTMKVERKGRFV
ncbi:hypothetical protein HZS61_010354 [Fusarium oxysporum f. sp. conglutinans]|uniref:Carboxypeptidase S1 A n=1 Tax=Fusarium oxysporum f. sp. conglutinans TaxID=100902 RepID=A0A8H6H1C2_FUSOX|nr:hypothetical protein HZS61_010354 [Fusarium oxysporum f. sp. conglutinans]